MKKLFTTIAIGIFASSSVSPVYAVVTADTLPNFNSATNAAVSTNGSTMNVQIQGAQGGVGTINWNSFNIGKDATVNYEFSNHNQTALNKVSATGGFSEIFGKITSSGCTNCGYEATGKVILVNPNGVLFGDGANVNLNSFTVTNMDAVYDQTTKELKLTTGANQSDFGIVVQDGANIYGAKNVTFAGNNIALYKGSKISTDTVANVKDTAYGKVKLVTADGVNFTYYNNGSIKEVSNVKDATNKMLISVNNEITSGHIDIRNASTNAESELNLKDAKLKAVKAEKGNDGNIWLKASNKVLTESTLLQTENGTTNAASRNGGNVGIIANNKASVSATNIDAVGNVEVTSLNQHAVIGSSIINTAKDVSVSAGNIASVQSNTKINAKNLTINGGSTSQVVASDITADKADISAKNVYLSNAKINLANDLKVAALNESIQTDSTSINAKNIYMDAAKNVTGSVNLNNNKTYITAGNDIDVTLTGVSERQNGLVAKAGNDMKVTTGETLSVSSLISGNNMTINANKVISGYDKTTNQLRAPGDSADRAYIEVNGTFTSNPDFVVTDSDGITADNQHQQRHHIQYGDGSEKILLVNKRPYTAPSTPTPSPTPSTVTSDEDDQASMLNRLPRQPQTMSNVTNIADGRTTFVDVFAAASQIEIVEDEEE